MKKHLLALFALVAVSFFCTNLAAQISIEQNVISVANATSELSNGETLTWTVGESFVTTHKIQDKLLTEGFHQPYLVACEDLKYSSKVTCIGNDEFIVELNVEGQSEHQLLIQGETHQFTNELVVGPFSNNSAIEASLKSKNSDVCFTAIRFENIDCKQDAAQIAGFNGQVQAEGNQIAWSLVKADENTRVALSSSNDGINFVPVIGVSVNQNNLVDFNTSAGFTYYRLTVADQTTGEVVDAQTIELVRVDQVSDVEINTDVFPNPVVDYLNVSFENYNEKEVVLSIYSVSGELLKTALVQVENRSVKMDMSEFGVAFYLLSVATPDGILLDTHKIQKLD